MSTLTDPDKRVLEALLGMGSGYVLDFTDDTFAALFARHDVDIHGPSHRTYGTSKAKKLRAFWDVEDDAIVGEILAELLESYEASCEIAGREANESLLAKARAIVARISGHDVVVSDGDPALQAFLQHEFQEPDVGALPIDTELAPIIEARWREARATFEAHAYLATIILAGSILEAVLLGVARSDPKRFNAASASPKDAAGKVRDFAEWKLASLVDAAHEIGILRKDVKDFSHALRNFRNFVHANRQLEEGFEPDAHTAKVCIHVLKGALSGVSNFRSAPGAQT